jgi:hypothetical protein
VTVNGQDVRVFAYDTVAALKQDAAQVSVDGGTIGMTSVRWMAPPRFYARSTFLALYVGADAEIIGALEGYLRRTLRRRGRRWRRRPAAGWGCYHRSDAGRSSAC